ncbi:hypothetical protein Taro_030973 [Colocasia esculenta]|uniref:Aminotransferase-like plant mobile domain-containing protein n=1 Tax=Colocasia esculenta TaxID=4460 RepID=A0A843VZH1_COLES|nr:hypothetical protein [Colocasia esculenta]
MGFGPFLWLEELTPDVALIQALKERWDPECHTFLFPWGHMIPTLEDVVRITDLRVGGQAVTRTTYTSYQEPVERLLGLEVRSERSSLVQRTALQASLGVANARHQTGESQAEYMAWLTEDARAVLAEEEGGAADRDLRRFLTLVIGKLILGTRGDPVGCRCLPLLEDLSSVGNYAWGAALLAHLFDSLGTSSRETGVAGYVSTLTFCCFSCLLTGLTVVLTRVTFARVGILPPPIPGPRGGEATQRCTSPAALAILPRRAVPAATGDPDPRHSGHHPIRPCTVDSLCWGERRCPAVGGARPSLLRYGHLAPLFQHSGPALPPASGADSGTPPGDGGVLDPTEAMGEARSQLSRDPVGHGLDGPGPGVAGRLGAAGQGGSCLQLDSEGRISSLKGILHSTIQQRDDLQGVVDQLRVELERAQKMVGGASSSREDPGRSVLEGQLASTAARAEDALAQLREREQELRTALARTTTLEAEMAELRLRPKAAEVARWREAAEEASRWRQEAKVAARWQQEAAEAARWHQEAEEAVRLRAEAGDLRTQLGEERHRCDMLRSEMKGLERALALVGCSRSATSRSGIPSGFAGHYLTDYPRLDDSTGLGEDMVPPKRMAPSEGAGGEASVEGSVESMQQERATSWSPGLDCRAVRTAGRNSGVRTLCATVRSWGVS